nr:unnamed protein product [Callosobruchus chinensis]
MQSKEGQFDSSVIRP